MGWLRFDSLGGYALIRLLSELPPHARLLRAIRKQRQWSQGQLAVELSVSSRTIRRWEHGDGEPNVRDLALFRALLEPGLQGTAWAHLATLDAIERDIRSGLLSSAQADALKSSLDSCLRAICGVVSGSLGMVA